MEIIYRAFDGKEFDDEELCEAYERIRTTPSECLGFSLYDANGDVVQLFDEDYRVNDDFYYIVTHDKTEAAALYDILNDAGISSPWNGTDNNFEAGRYYYDSEDYKWKNFKDFEDSYNYMLNIFNQDKGK